MDFTPEPILSITVEQASAALTAATERTSVRLLLSVLLLLPLVATAGQYWSSGFWRQPIAVDVLFWPGA